MPPLVVCPHCNVHAKLIEDLCPHCGKALRRTDGTIPRTAAAVVLGLSVAATGVASCSEAVDEYGGPPTSAGPSGSGGAGGEGGEGSGGTTNQGGGGQGGDATGGAGGSTGIGGDAPMYGIAGSGGV